jgi:hypothetical protein
LSTRRRPLNSITEGSESSGARPPRRLYTYRSMAAGRARRNTLGNIKNLYFWYAHPSTFNDPFDCNFDMPLETAGEEALQQMVDTAGEIGKRVGQDVAQQVEDWWEKQASPELKARIRSFGEKAPPKLKEWLRSFGSKVPPTQSSRWLVKNSTMSVDGGPALPPSEALRGPMGKYTSKAKGELDAAIGVLALSEQRDNLLLWSHYANNHDGLCFELDCAAHPSAFPNLSRVRYQDYPVISWKLANIVEALGSDASILLQAADLSAEFSELDSPQTEMLRQYFLTKSSYWAYEREWRALKPAAGPLGFPKSALKGIIVGCKNTKANLAAVRRATAGSKIALSIARMRPDAFALDIEPAK